MKMNLKDILRNDRGKPIIGLSVYDYFGARLAEEFQEIDFVLVGDSLSMVFKGKPNVKHVTLDEMLYHLRIVKDIVTDKPIILDMPIGTYEKMEDAYRNVYKAISDGADGVMIEGIHIETMEMLSNEGISYIVHLGYMPKYHQKPVIIKDYEKLLHESKTCQEYGANAIKFELVDKEVTKKIREDLEIPILGVGSGPHVDGHILVLYDFIGMYPEFKAKFVRKYVDIYRLAYDALSKLIKDIQTGDYPSEYESY